MKNLTVLQINARICMLQRQIERLREIFNSAKLNDVKIQVEHTDPDNSYHFTPLTINVDRATSLFKTFINDYMPILAHEVLLLETELESRFAAMEQQ